MNQVTVLDRDQKISGALLDKLDAQAEREREERERQAEEIVDIFMHVKLGDPPYELIRRVYNRVYDEGTLMGLAAVYTAGRVHGIRAERARHAQKAESAPTDQVIGASR